jgi:hypothetical protein
MKYHQINGLRHCSDKISNFPATLRLYQRLTTARSGLFPFRPLEFAARLPRHTLMASACQTR